MLRYDTFVSYESVAKINVALSGPSRSNTMVNFQTALQFWGGWEHLFRSKGFVMKTGPPPGPSQYIM